LAQIHRRFTDDQVKELIEKYLRKEVSRKYLQDILGGVAGLRLWCNGKLVDLQKAKTDDLQISAF